MTIYLLENNKETGEVAKVDIEHLKQLIMMEKKRLRDLRRIKDIAEGKHSCFMDKEYLQSFGVKFKVFKLRG